jgi:hypothetical protein
VIFALWGLRIACAVGALSIAVAVLFSLMAVGA